MRRFSSVAYFFSYVGLVGFSCGLCFGQTSNEEFTARSPADVTAVVAAPVQPGEAAPTPKGSVDSSNRFGVGVKVSTLGIGGEVAYRLTHRFNVRGGFNLMSLSHTFNDNGITYGGQLRFRSVEGHLDWFFLGPLHLSPGVLFYNGNQVKATVAVPAGDTFSLNGVTYESSSAQPVGGNAMLTLNKVAPSILLGVGNLIPRSGRHFSVPFEIGGIYEGAPNITLNFTGTACTPPNTSGPTCQDMATNSAIQTNVQAQQSKFNHDAAPYKFYPVISLGFAIAF